MKKYGENEAHNTWQKAHYNTADPNDKLIFNLRDISHTMRFLYEGKGSQKRILIVLGRIGTNITQQKLTEQLGIQPGSASEVIAKLESAGYIARTPNETDRRTMDISLTDAGKAAAAEAIEQRTLRHEQMFSCLSDAEKSELLSLLEKVNADWRERYPDIESLQNPCGYHKGSCRHLQGDAHGKKHHGEGRHGKHHHGEPGCEEDFHKETHHKDRHHEKQHHSEHFHEEQPPEKANGQEVE